VESALVCFFAERVFIVRWRRRIKAFVEASSQLGIKERHIGNRGHGGAARERGWWGIDGFFKKGALITFATVSRSNEVENHRRHFLKRMADQGQSLKL
jgi:hypothetical protein